MLAAETSYGKFNGKMGLIFVLFLSSFFSSCLYSSEPAFDGDQYNAREKGEMKAPSYQPLCSYCAGPMPAGWPSPCRPISPAIGVNMTAPGI